MAKKRYTVIDASSPKLSIKCKSCKGELRFVNTIGSQPEENEIVKCPICGEINHNTLNKKEIIIKVE